MASIWDELKRRKVFQVAVVYAIVGWVLAQVAATVFPVLLLPDWILRAFVIVLLLGFPIAIVLAWAFETTPEGIKRDQGEDSTASASSAGPSRGPTYVSLVALASFAAGLILGGLAGRSSIPIPDVIEASIPIQLTANPPELPVISSAISPDGQYLAYTQMDGLYLRVIESGEAHKIETPERFSFEGSEIRWFPNGTHLLFTAREDAAPALWKLAIVGGPPKKLTASAVSPVITGDGSRIAYLPDRLSNEIYVMGPEGEEADRLVQLENDGIWRLGWSPNGKFLLFGTGLMDSQVLRAVNVATSNIHVVMQDTRTFQNWRGYLPFEWTSDGKLIFARREIAPNNSMSNLWQVPLSADRATVDGVPVPITNITGYNFRDISASSDNSRVAFLIEQNQLDVYVAETPSGNPELENVRRLTFDERSDMPGGWADNKTVYFQSRRGAAQNIFSQDIFSGEAIALTGALVNSDDAVEKSPDGKWLLYWDEDPGDASVKNLIRQPVNGGQSTLTLQGTASSDFHCPASVEIDVDCIVSLREPDNQYAFYEFSPEYGLGARLLSVEDRLPFTNWELSPDGTTAALVHNRGAARIVDLLSGVEREISKEGWLLGEFVDWSNDGRGLYMDGSAESDTFRKSLIYFSLDTNEAIEIRQFQNQWHVKPKISPDGEHIAFGLMIFSGNAWMIENS